MAVVRVEDATGFGISEIQSRWEHTEWFASCCSLVFLHFPHLTRSCHSQCREPSRGVLMQEHQEG
eukprot:990947-Rhodomonas_salina.6